MTHKSCHINFLLENFENEYLETKNFITGTVGQIPQTQSIKDWLNLCGKKTKKAHYETAHVVSSHYFERRRKYQSVKSNGTTNNK